jgi:hypothetical protein
MNGKDEWPFNGQDRLGIQFLSPWCCLTIAAELIKWYLIRVLKTNKKN